MPSFKDRTYRLLRWSERYTKTDMIYIAKSGFWINLGSVSVTGFSFVLYLAFARFLAPEVYGTYQYLLSVATIVGAFTLTGMNSAVTRAVARGQEGTLRASVMVQLRWSILPLLGSWVAGSYYLAQGNPTLGFGLILIGIFVPINNALNTFGALPGGRGDFRSSFFLNLFSNTLYYPALIVTAFFSTSALLLLAANLISQGIAIALSYAWAVRTYHPNASVDPESLRYGKHLSAMGLFSSIIAQIDTVLVFHFLGAAPLALYSFATAMPDRIANLTKFVQSAAFPRFSQMSLDEIRASLRSRLIWLLLGSMILAGLYAAAAPLLFALFFPAYTAAVPYSMLYAAIIVPFMSGLLISALTAGRSTGSLYAFNIAMPLLQLVLQAAGILVAGLWGLIIGRLIAASMQLALASYLLLRRNP